MMFFDLAIHFTKKLMEKLWERLWHRTMPTYSWTNLKGNLYPNISLNPPCHPLVGSQFFSHRYQTKNP